MKNNQQFHSVSIAFYARNPDDWASNAIYFLGKLFRHNMDLVHVLFEFDGAYLELTIDGLFYIPKDVADDELDTPDVRLTLSDVSEEEYQKMYETAELLMSVGSRLHVRDLLRVMLNKTSYGLVCTDIPLLMLGVPPMGLTAYELFESLLPLANEIENSEYGQTLVEKALTDAGILEEFKYSETDEHGNNSVG